jgi:hypothetical protein
MPEPMVSELLDNQELFQVKDAPVIKRSVFALFSTDNKNPEMIKTACDFFN